jgi:hypothetical protein
VSVHSGTRPDFGIAQRSSSSAHLHRFCALTSREELSHWLVSKQYNMRHRTCVSVTNVLTSAGGMFLVDLTSAKYVLANFHAVSMNVGSASYKPAGDAEITGCEVMAGFMLEEGWREYERPQDV